jgi:membrane fusion protein (multidrug efflux system)
MADTIVGQNRIEKDRVEAPPPPPTGRRPRGRRLGRILVPIVILIALGVGGYILWQYLSTYESTDDAGIDGHVDAISARITGHVNEVLVEDAQVVKGGDTLVRIDPQDYEVAVAQAEANVADAEASMRSSRTDVPIISTNTASSLETARASRVNADAGVVNAQRQLEAAQAALETAQAQVIEAEAIHKDS